MARYKRDETIKCPICRQRFADDNYCEHLVVSADDSEILSGVTRFADADSLWQALRNTSMEKYVGDVIAFMRSFVEPCEAAARVDEQVWDGGFPGLSGLWIFVWSADAAKLREEIRNHFLDELARIKRLA